MDDAGSDTTALAAARELVSETALRLAADGTPNEALAEFVPARRVLLMPRAPRMVPLGRVWRLGVLLLGTDGSLYATGVITRVTDPGRPQNLHGSVEERRTYRAAALKGGYRVDDVVNHHASVIELDASALREARGPLFVNEGTVWVRWSPSADTAQPFDRYLAEWIELAEHPPEGA